MRRSARTAGHATSEEIAERAGIGIAGRAANSAGKVGSGTHGSCTISAVRNHPMPLRDHFRPPVSRFASWEAVHGGWPMMIAQSLNGKLPARFVAHPNVH